MKIWATLAHPGGGASASESKISGSIGSLQGMVIKPDPMLTAWPDPRLTAGKGCCCGERGATFKLCCGHLSLPRAKPPSVARESTLSTRLSRARDAGEPHPACSSRLSDAHARRASAPAAELRIAHPAYMSSAAWRWSPDASHASAAARSWSTPMPTAPCLRTSPLSCVSTRLSSASVCSATPCCCAWRTCQCKLLDT